MAKPKTAPSATPEKRASKRSAPAAQPAGTAAATIDRRRQSRRVVAQPASQPETDPPQQLERRKKVNRRRQIDPTTCERDYSGDEVEFMNALDDYKRTSGRMFPTCSEVLEVIRSLGYSKQPVAAAASREDGPLQTPEQACSTDDGAPGYDAAEAMAASE